MRDIKVGDTVLIYDYSTPYLARVLQIAIPHHEYDWMDERMYRVRPIRRILCFARWIKGTNVYIPGEKTDL
jgi:hypothetical protein